MVDAVPTEEPGPPLPRTFGGYTLLALLGQGGMGEVYLAARGGIEGISRRCVVKTLRPGFSDDREYVTRFLDEARVVAQLHHRNICPTFDVGKVNAQHYLAMEYIAGRDLKTIVERAKKAGTPISQRLALFIMSETLDALNYAHELSDETTGDPLLLVHRDISPHNVMVSFDGDVRLIDFGLAASTLKVEQTAPNVVMGKVAYMAPEQICGEVLDARADQYAAAVMAVELLLNTRFYEGRSVREIYGLAAPGGFRPKAFTTLPAPLQQALEKALAADVGKRFETCGDLRAAIDEFRQQQQERGREGAELKALMRAVFADDIAAERAMVARAAGLAGVPANHVITSSMPHLGAQKHEDTAKNPVIDPDIPSVSQPTPSIVALPPSEPTSFTRSAQVAKKKQKAPLFAAAAGIAVGVVVAIAVAVGSMKKEEQQTPPPPPPPVVAIVETPPPPLPVPTPPPPVEVVEPPPPPPPPPPVEVVEPQKKPQKKPQTHKPAVPVPVPTTVGGQIKFLQEHCPKATCVAPLMVHAKDWGTLQTEALVKFRKDLAACVSKCPVR